MALTKKQRHAVWDKSGGYCWYCGCQLPEKGWHADHLESVIRVSKLVRGVGSSMKFVATGEMMRAHNNKLENIVPACAPCNLFKSTHSVEFFRQELAAQVERARKCSVNFRMAERFGLITVNERPVEFWFEREAKE